MRRLVVEENHGLYQIVTSDGTQVNAASLSSALAKLDRGQSLAAIFESIVPRASGQIHEGTLGS